MSAHLEPTTPEETPEPSAALSFVRVMAEAYVFSLQRREAFTFLQKCADIFEQREDASNVVPIRRNERLKKQIIADRQALAEFRRMLESCMARMQRALDAEDDPVI